MGDGQQSRSIGERGNWFFAEQPAEDKPGNHAAEDFCDEQRAAFLEDVRRRGELNGSAHADVKGREDSERSSEKRLCEGTEELRSFGRKARYGWHLAAKAPPLTRRAHAQSSEEREAFS